MNELENRVYQFRTMSLPGQPLGMHMGTSYLVNDLWQRVQDLERQNELLRNFASAALSFQADLRRRAPSGCGSKCNVIHSTYALNVARKAAIDGGALEEGK